MYKYYKDFGKEDAKKEFVQVYNKFVNSEADILIDKSDLETKLMNKLNQEFKSILYA